MKESVAKDGTRQKLDIVLLSAIAGDQTDQYHAC